MRVEYTYPAPQKISTWFERIRMIFKWLFVAATAACVVLNIILGGKAWSVVVFWAVWSVWRVVLSPDMVELNLISLTAKSVLFLTILLLLIDICLAPGWAEFVIPVIVCMAMIASTVFFISNIREQKQNIMPMIWLMVFSLIAFILALFGLIVLNWPFIVLGCTTICLSIVGIIIFFVDLKKEMIKRFHTK